ncbi:glycoside hydrolase family 5 protein [Trametes coccinea BRFM310]|uniref:glucan 1,3-beta-glucosidase n=1 Tax=Trametes coccinea (strain BRFM310) TaxID=1353009 RepID=A0A1Y2ICD8_TRAC3|nr:glycoside hydrolase family 5 protein [Trametes coccinea BRFM310]
MSRSSYNPFDQPGGAGPEMQHFAPSSPFLDPPRPLSGSIPDRSLASTPRDDAPMLSHSGSAEAVTKESYSNESSDFGATKPLIKRPWVWIVAATGILAVVVVAVVVPVYFTVVKPNHNNSVKSGTASGSDTNGSGNAAVGSGTASATAPVQTAVTTGGDGSTVTMEDGTTFTYKNQFGGFWVNNPEDPFDNSAQCNSWTPPLNQTWTWGKDRIWGVNIGGLFVLEPFIVPALYEANPGSVDEWTLSTLLAQKGEGQLQSALEDHYNTFITEQDIAEIAGAGLNWIRLQIPFWAIEAWGDVGTDDNGNKVAEPFLARTCWKYVLRLLGWARKYGLRVNLDLHTIPGSQNGFNHSGKSGSINWMNGPMGIANAERSLDYMRIITEFISQPEWKDLIPIFSMINEPFMAKIGRDQVESFYLKAYNMARGVTGTGAGNGPMLAFHDGFSGPGGWAGFLSGADRLALDTHPYFAFNGKANRDPVNVTADGGDGQEFGGQWPLLACTSWGKMMNTSRQAFGVTFAGEFSNAINDCGLYVNGVNGDTAANSAYGPGCSYWEDYANWSDENKQGLLNFALASMDALGDWFFWTWKIGPSSTTNSVRAPLWSYQLGLQNGWMPTDPRVASGKCEHLGADMAPFDGNFQSWQTGGAGAGVIAPAATQDLAWPPQLSNVAAADQAQLPQYTPTGTLSTLPPPTFSTPGVTVTATVGNGWSNNQDTTPMVTPIAGCAYPDAWDALNAAIPAGGCQPAA